MNLGRTSRIIGKYYKYKKEYFSWFLDAKEAIRYII